MTLHQEMMITDFLKRFDKPKYRVGDAKKHLAHIAGMKIPYQCLKVYLLNNGKIDPLRYWDIAFDWKGRGKVFEVNYFNKRLKIYRRLGRSINVTQQLLTK